MRLTILFGTSMLVSHLIPGLVIGVILAANGCVLLYMLHLLIVLDKMQSEVVGADLDTKEGSLDVPI